MHASLQFLRCRVWRYGPLYRGGLTTAGARHARRRTRQRGCGDSVVLTCGVSLGGGA